MADVIRNVTVRYKLEPIDTKVPPPKVKEAQKAITGHSKIIIETNKKSVESYSKVQESVAKVTKETEKAKRETVEFASVAKAEGIKAAEGFRTAGEGAFTMARGIALLGISAEDDLAKVVKTIAKVQGAFDLFKGGIDVIKGVREGLIAMKAASVASASANTVLAASNTAVAVTAGTATKSLTTMKVAMGPIGIAGLAIAAAAAFLLMRKNSPAESIDKTTAALTRQNAALRATAQTRKDIAAIGMGGDAARAARGRQRRALMTPARRAERISGELVSLDVDEQRTDEEIEQETGRNIESLDKADENVTMREHLLEKSQEELERRRKLKRTPEIKEGLKKHRLIVEERKKALRTAQVKQARAQRVISERNIETGTLSRQRADQRIALLTEQKESRQVARDRASQKAEQQIHAQVRGIAPGVSGPIAPGEQQRRVALEIAELKEKENVAVAAANERTVTALQKSIDQAERMENRIEAEERRIATLEDTFYELREK